MMAARRRYPTATRYTALGLTALATATTLALAAPAAARAQCVGSMAPRRGTAIYASAGAFSYDFQSPINGTELGAGAARRIGPLAVELSGAIRTLDSDASLVVGRGEALVASPPLPFIGRLCLAGGVGMARLTEDASGTSSTNLSVPVGVRLGTTFHLPTARLEPYVQPRVVVSQTTGEAFGLSVTHSAVGAGVDGGVTVFMGPLVAGLAAHWSSLDDALGPHAGMDTGATLRVGLHF